MSYKSIDFQTSIPRTAELAPLAQQQQQKFSSEQAMLAQQHVKTAEQQAARPAKTEAPSEGKITDQQKRGGGRQTPKGKKRTGGTVPEKDPLSEHPFKGKHIDFIG